MTEPEGAQGGARTDGAGAAPGGRHAAPALSRADAEDFLYREARLLDERRFEEWLALFAPQGRYYIPGGEGDDPAAEAAILDDDRPTLEDRVQRLRSPATYAQSPPSRTAHVVSNVEVEAEAGREADGAVRVRCTAVVHEARLGQVRAVAMRCAYRLVPAGGGGDRWRWLIMLKVVRLIDYDRPLHNLTFLL